MLSERKIYIYLVENINNSFNKVYIGKTKNKYTRENQHKIKYGNNIIYSIIDEVDSLDKKDWKPLECYWIEQFKCWGFEVLNKNKGGGGIEFHSNDAKKKMKGRKHPGTSEKLKGVKRPEVSNKLLGRNLSEETKKKISNSKKGHNCYKSEERGKKISNSNIIHYKKGSNRNKKISEALKGRKITWKNKMGKSILQYDLEGNLIKEWESITQASIELKIKGIGNALTKRSKTAGGFIWKYFEEI